MLAQTQNRISQIPFVNKYTKASTYKVANIPFLFPIFVNDFNNNNIEQNRHKNDSTLLKKGTFSPSKICGSEARNV